MADPRPVPWTAPPIAFRTPEDRIAAGLAEVAAGLADLRAEEERARRAAEHRRAVTAGAEARLVALVGAAATTRRPRHLRPGEGEGARRPTNDRTGDGAGRGAGRPIVVVSPVDPATQASLVVMGIARAPRAPEGEGAADGAPRAPARPYARILIE